MSKGRATPLLSVVIASSDGPAALAPCLEVLAGQVNPPDMEIIVADRVGRSVEELVRERHPRVRLLAFDRSVSLPELRLAAIRTAVGEIIALTEDHCLPAPRWCAAVAAAHRREDAAVIGGPVVNGATRSLVDWAAFLCEYSSFAPPIAAGRVNDLAVSNVSYKRAALEAVDDVMGEGFEEFFVHGLLRERGFAMLADSTLEVVHRREETVLGFFAARYRWGRAFARSRCGHLTPWRRWLHWIGAPVLPLLLTARIAGRALRRPGHRAPLLLSSPLVALFATAAAAGEWSGYLAGARSRASSGASK